MRLFRAELRKVTSSKIVCILLIVLLAISFGVTWYTSHPVDNEVISRRVYKQYLEDPEGMTAYREELFKLNELDFEIDPETLNMTFKEVEIPITYDESGRFDDLHILYGVYKRVEYLESGYKDKINKLIRLTEQKIDDMYGFNYEDDSFEIRSQKAILEKYESLLTDVDIGTEYSYGYDVYFKNGSVTVFTCLFVLIAAAYVFLNDSNVGFENILRITKKGRMATFAAKASLLAMITVIGVILFQASAFAATGIANGYSSAHAPIQSLPDFVTVPYQISILEYALIQLGARILAFLALAFFVSLFASLRLPYAACIGGGAVLCGVNVLIFSKEYFGTVPPQKYLNLAALADVNELFEYYRPMSVFGLSVPYDTMIFVLSALITVIFIALGSFLYCKKVKLFSLRVKNLIPKSTREKKESLGRQRHKKTHTLPIFAYELKKNRILLCLVIIALLLFARGAYVTSSIGSMKTYGEAIYYEYIETINPLDAEERGEYMRAERERLSSILNAKKAMDDAYQKGEISSMEYFEYKDSYLDADRHDKVFVNVEEYVKYVDKKNTQLGIDGDVIYTTGYEKLFGLASDVFLYAALLVLCINVFAVEYSFGTSQGGFSQIMRAAKRGRSATFFSKLISFAVIGALVAVIFRLYTYYCVSGKYVLPGLDATLYSIESFSSVSTDMTIGEFFAIDLCMQFFAGAFIAIVISLFSLFFKRVLVIISTGILCIGIPEILAKTVLPELCDFSVLSLTEPISLFTSSAKRELFGSDVSYLVAVCIGFIVVAAMVAAVGYVRFCKTRYPDSDRNKNNGGNRV